MNGNHPNRLYPKEETSNLFLLLTCSEESESGSRNHSDIPLGEQQSPAAIIMPFAQEAFVKWLHTVLFSAVEMWPHSYFQLRKAFDRDLPATCGSVSSDSLRPQGLPPGLSVHGILQARILECCYFLLQGIFPTQGSDAHLLHCRWILYRRAIEEAPQVNEREGGEGRAEVGRAPGLPCTPPLH